MWGERFFHTRDRLAACRARIEALAKETGLGPREMDEAAALLARPWLGVIVGEVNAGKSALLNALAGSKIAEVAPVPCTRQITAHVIAGAELPVGAPGGLAVETHRSPALARIGWVDGPGLNGPHREEWFAALPALARLDLMLVVFPADNTWTAATWEWVSRLDDEALGRTALVVQMADKKSAEDLRVIRGHMRDLALKKIGRELPILAVAASPSSGEPDLAAIEGFLEERMCRAAERLHLLDRAFHEAFRRMREIEDGLDRQKRGMDDDGWFLDGLEREAVELRDLLIEASADEREKELAVYAVAVAAQAAELRRKTGFWGTLGGLLFGDSPGTRVEAAFDVRLRAIVDAFARRDVERVFAECAGHWGAVRPRVIERMALDPGGLPPMLDGERGRVAGAYIDRMGRAVPGFLGGLRLRALIDDLLRQRSRRLRAPFGLWLLLVTLMGACGTLRLEPWAQWLAVLVAGGGLLLLVAFWLTRRSVIRQFKERLLDASGRFESSIARFQGEAVHEVFEEYGQGLIAVRRRLAERKSMLGPLSARRDTLYLELKTVEQEWSD